MSKLSHNLLDLGFFCALGTPKYGTNGQPNGDLVRCGEPNRWDWENGVTVFYDEAGQPWIMDYEELERRGIVHQVDVMASGIRRGAYVPHSNDAGVFVHSVLPSLREPEPATA